MQVVDNKIKLFVIINNIYICMSVLGNCYILTISDHFTKWVEAIATPDKSAVQVASSLFKVSTKL